MNSRAIFSFILTSIENLVYLMKYYFVIQPSFHYILDNLFLISEFVRICVFFFRCASIYILRLRDSLTQGWRTKYHYNLGLVSLYPVTFFTKSLTFTTLTSYLWTFWLFFGYFLKKVNILKIRVEIINI